MSRSRLLAWGVLLALAAPADAEVPALPPVLSGAYDAATGTVLLSWEPPPSWTPGLGFRVYENGVPIADTAATTYTAPATGTLQVFQVAVANGTEEGAWSNPFTLTGGPLDCPVVGVNLLPPAYEVHETCIPPVGARGCYVRVDSAEPPLDYTISDACYRLTIWTPLGPVALPFRILGGP